MSTSYVLCGIYFIVSMGGDGAPTVGDAGGPNGEHASGEQGDAGVGSPTSPSGIGQHVLVDELRHVLDAQQRLVDRQQSRASTIVRFVLTAVGLSLTVASLVATNSIGVQGVVERAAVGWIAVVRAGVLHTTAVLLVAVLCVLACRILCAALVVLEPQTAVHPLGRLLTTPVAAGDRPTADRAGGCPDRPLTLRTGLDADAIHAASATQDPTPSILAYNAGCIAGNAALLDHNRWYLTRAYRSATLAVALSTLATLAVLTVFGGRP